jgi:hypothetical protein
MEVNSEWKNNTDGVLLTSFSDFKNNRTFDDWIATHLMLVEKTLRQRSMEQLNDEQKKNRLNLLDGLNGYWHSSTFPKNDYLTYKNPVFIDRHGNYCAVGFLMKQSGADALARAIDADNKFVYVKNIKTNGVKEWAKKNGFTIDELAWIQPGYPVTFSVDFLSEGLNGTVNCMLVDSVTQEFFAGGSFTSSTRGATCNGIAQYISGIAGWDWVGLGNGVNGTVKTIIKFNNKLYVGGSFTMAGSVAALNVAAYDLTSGQWEAVGSLDNTVNSLIVYNNEIYAGGIFSNYFSKWDGNQWQDINQGWLTNAEIRTLEVYDNMIMIGGNFELPTGALRKNVATYDGVQMLNAGFGTPTPVNDFVIHKDTLYAALDFVYGNDSCALSRYENFDWVNVLDPTNFPDDYLSGKSIQHLLSVNDRLFCSGYFYVYAFTQYGNNIMEYKPGLSSGSNCIPLMLTDSTIYTIELMNNLISFGGAFNTTGSLHHIGQLTSVTIGMDEISNNTSNKINVYPNPAVSHINVNVKDFINANEYQITISDITGREIYREPVSRQTFSMDLSFKNLNGIYLLRIVDGDGITKATEKLLIQ